MKRSTVIALGAFMLLLAAVLVTRETHVNVGVPKVTLPAIDPGTVSSVEVSGPNQAMLTLENGAWLVASLAAPTKKFAADDAQVKNALTQLAELRPGDFVTENTAKHAELEVDETKGLRVKVATAGSGPVLDVIIGKAAKSGGAYFRMASSNSVFTTSSNIGYALRKTVAGWRQKAISIAPIAEVKSISVAPLEGDGFTLVQADGAWALEGGAPKGYRFDPAAAGGVAQTITSLSAQDFADNDTGFGEQRGSAMLTLKDGKTSTLRFGTKRPDSNVPMKVDGDPQVYVISGYVVEHLSMHLDQLRDLSLLTFAPEKINRLTLTDGAGKKTVVAKDGTSWKLVEPKVAPAQFDPQQVGAVLTRLQGLHAARVETAKSAAQAGVAKAAATVELTGDGAPKTLRFGGEVPEGAVGKQLYVKGSADELIYVISASEKSSYQSGVTLFNKPPPPPPSSNMQGLDSLPPDIRAKIEAQLRQQQPH